MIQFYTEFKTSSKPFLTKFEIILIETQLFKLLTTQIFQKEIKNLILDSYSSFIT